MKLKQTPALAIAVLTAVSGLTDTKEIFCPYPNEPWPVGWPAATNTVGQAFANQVIPDGTMVYCYNEGNQSFDLITYDLGAWDNPSYLLRTGRAFYIRHTDPYGHTFVLNYSPLPPEVEYLDIALSSGGWHFLSYGWDLPDKGCVLERPWDAYWPFVRGNLWWPGSCADDTVLTFNYDVPTQWNEWNRYSDCTRKWSPAPDLISPAFWDYWKPFWFYNNSSQRTWRQYPESETE